jgi:hypothetical protein
MRFSSSVMQRAEARQLLSAGGSIRAVVAATGLGRGAVHRMQRRSQPRDPLGLLREDAALSISARARRMAAASGQSWI